MERQSFIYQNVEPNFLANLKGVNVGAKTNNRLNENHFFKIFLKAPCKFLVLIEGTFLWLGITCYFLATWGQRLTGAARVQTLDPQISSLICHGM